MVNEEGVVKFVVRLKAGMPSSAWLLALGTDSSSL
jgi:hypothetical protein